MNTNKRLQVEATLGDGNCAFNAFALGLVNPAIFADIEKRLAQQQIDPDRQFAAFIQAVATKLSLSLPAEGNHWQFITQQLVRLRQNDKMRLQRLLADILRQGAYHLSANHPGHAARMLLLLNSAFTAYVYQCQGRPVKGAQDDIFRHHESIIKKFA